MSHAMTEFRPTATHDGRAVPMPEVDASACDALDLCHGLWNAYRDRFTESTAQDMGDLRARILADARASAAPSEDAIRCAMELVYAARKRISYDVTDNVVRLEFRTDAGAQWFEKMMREADPRPVYAAPVRLSDGSTFGQVGPDAFAYTFNGGDSLHNARHWRGALFTPADGALVRAVLDGAEAKR